MRGCFRPWGSTDPPWVAIYSPSATVVGVDGDREETYRFRASVASGLQEMPTVRWYLIDSSRGRQALLGTGPEVTYVPDSARQWAPLTFGGALRPEGIYTVGVEVIDANGTAYDSVGFNVNFAPR